MRKLDIALVVWCVVSVMFWIWYSLVTGTIIPFVLYYPLWLGGVGTLTWRYRNRIRQAFRSWAAAAPVKFAVLGFGAVLCEEVLAAVANHVPEGFSPLLFVVRIVQFWDLNVFTFFGFIVGWYGLIRYLRFSEREVFYLAGAWGLYAEKVLFVVPSNPLFFVFDFAPAILTYGLIITPAMWSQAPGANRKWLHPVLKYPLAYAVVFACSIPAILLLQLLRQSAPALFPPASMVPP